MSEDIESPDQNYDIPEDAVVVKQVKYAWLWSALPWLIILGVVYYTDFLIEPVPWLGALITVIILLPRYLSWRRTVYYLTEDSLIYQRGSLTGFQRYKIPWTNLKDAQPKYGSFGKSLGYQTVELVMMDDKAARLPYISIFEDVAGEIRTLILNAGHLQLEVGDDASQDADTEVKKEPEQSDSVSKSEDPRKYSPDTSRFDPDDRPSG